AFICASDDFHFERATSYGANVLAGYGRYVRFGEGHKLFPDSLVPVPDPSLAAWYADVGFIRRDWGWEVYFRKHTAPILRNLSWRHSNTLNVSYMDGHAGNVQNPNFDNDLTLLNEWPWAPFFGN